MSQRLALAAAIGAAIAMTGCTAAATDDSAGGPIDGVSTGVDETGAAESPAVAPDSAALQAAPLGGRDRPTQGEPGIPGGSGASVDDVLRTGAVATWVSGAETFAISLPASGECWPSAGTPTVVADQQLSVAFDGPGSCPGADAARTYELALPDGIDARAEVEVALEGLEHRYTLTLPAR
ncbi:hypothetical protein AA0Z99_08225 [Agrococcus sp. 1P02AA]|uniref:hypothetical protein n=1 Tax=Agrococcus sp. 1P02AA TaxID=3132259 RepID=UPI0039A6BBB0